jgi:hemerythrin-like domain-containing protein
MIEVMRILKEEHENLTRLLDLLNGEIEALGKGGNPDYDLISALLEYNLTFPDLCHHPKEDVVLAKLKEINPEAAAEVGDLEAEHRDLAGLARRFAEGVRNVLAEEAVSRDDVMKMAREFSQFLHRHIEMEERVFFPAALKNLKAEDWDDIDRAVHTPPDPLFGPEVDTPFLELRAEIDRQVGKST